MFLSTFAENKSLNLLCYKKPRFWAFLLRCGLEVYAVCHIIENWSYSQGTPLRKMADFHQSWSFWLRKWQICVKIDHFRKGVPLRKWRIFIQIDHYPLENIIFSSKFIILVRGSPLRKWQILSQWIILGRVFGFFIGFRAVLLLFY